MRPLTHFQQHISQPVLFYAAAARQSGKNWAQSGTVFPNLIYWRHLDKSQSVISFDVA